MERRQISRGLFLKGAAGVAGAAVVAGQVGSALAQATPEGLSSGRPIRGRLGPSSGGRTAEYGFEYPGGEVVYTVEMQVMPENLFPQVGFQIYNPNGSVHVKGGAQSGLVPNVAANVVSRQAGRYVVQVYNYSPDAGIDYSLRVVSGVREGEPGARPVPPLETARQLPLVAYVGTYSEPAPRKGEGILVYYMDPTSGAWAHGQTVGGVRNPSFLALDPQQRFLYAVEEVNDVDDRRSGAVSAFSVDQSTGQLTWLNRKSSGGAHPAHLTVDPSGRFVLVANYTGSNVEVLPIMVDGSLGDPTDLVSHAAELGLGPNSGRQNAPHPHAIPFDPGGRFILVPDLGLDRTFVYRLNPMTGKLTANDPPFAMASKPGAGPRHIAFHPGGSVAYVINELNSTIDVFGYDGERGALRLMQTISTLPAGFEGMSTTAEVVVAPSGRHVYGSNRGHDSIAIFAVDPASGTLTSAGWVPVGGRTPRNFNIDPTGAYLYAANQNTDNIWAFQIDQGSGQLAPLYEIKVGTPVDIIFAV
jgi:6-phosphogluconolactonase